MNDPESLRSSSQMSGRTPEQIHAWYEKLISYHAEELRKWERAVIFTRLPVEGPPPPY